MLVQLTRSIICCCLLFPILANAQDLNRRLPADAGTPLSRIPQYQLPNLNNAELLANEMRQRRIGRAPEFAYPVEVNVDPKADGAWEQLPGGRWLWRERIRSAGALSLNLGFSDYYMPPGAFLLIYDPAKTQLLGPFSPADNEPHATLWTPIINGDELILEVQVPAEYRDALRLHLKYVNHDFAGLEKTLAGNCNLDVVCTAENGWKEVDQYRDAIQSVALLTIDGKTNCTGFLINNARNDCRPYLVTARHCDIVNGNAASVVVYWNFQNSTCREPGSSANANPGDGLRNKFNTGVILRASYTPSDFVLLELDDPIHPEADAWFAGWSIDTLLPAKGVATVHHPVVREKRISLSRQPVYTGAWGQGALQIAGGNHIIVPKWDVGTTEDGSSGAPLFNDKQQVIGQLHGGAAACGNQAFDAFGWIRASWEGGGNRLTRLKDWLDPDTSGVVSIPGRKETRCRKVLTANTRTQQICLPGNASFTLKASEFFNRPVRLSIDALPAFLKAGFSLNPVGPGDSTRLTFTAGAEAAPGNYPLFIKALDGEDSVYLQIQLELSRQPDPPALIYPFPQGRDIPNNPVLTWQRHPLAQTYRVQASRDSLLKQIFQTAIVKDTFFRLSDLEFKEQYFWTVSAINSCGESLPAGTAGFTTTPDFRVSFLEEQKDVCNTDTLFLQLQLGVGFREPVALSYQMDTDQPLEIIFNQPLESLMPGAVIKAAITNLYEWTAGSYTITITANDSERIVTTSSSFTLRTTPEMPTLLSPASDTGLVVSRPVLSWTKVPDAKGYRLELARDTDFKDPVQVFESAEATRRQLQELLPGKYYWRVSAQNDCGSSASTPKSFSIHTGNLDEVSRLFVAIDPNPTDGQVRVIFSAPVEDATIEVYSINGQRLNQLQTVDKQAVWPVDLSPYPSGVYLIRVRYRQDSATRKVVLNR